MARTDYSRSTDNGGAIPSNLLQIPNSKSNSRYNIKLFKVVDIPSHPARFSQQISLFFMNFLTEPGDIVIDIFAGSNTTDATAKFV
ncbi:DNA methyltransferase [Nostoc sp.]|uniref:DNA methyltransferase n=1 Tax=Nostoc sp. TaxID=1180 RepID=UPI003FA6019D